MDTITIGQWYAEKWPNYNYDAIRELTPDRQIERNKDYYKLVDEIKEKLGISDGYLSGNPPYVFAKIDGLFYRQSTDWNNKLLPTFFWEKILDNDLPPSDGEIMCECGNKSFHIFYGDYECLGTCTNCGETHQLYSG